MGVESGRMASLRVLLVNEYEQFEDNNDASHTFSLLQGEAGNCGTFRNI